jgi:hypothetical protein
MVAGVIAMVRILALLGVETGGVSHNCSLLLRFGAAGLWCHDRRGKALIAQPLL